MKGTVTHFNDLIEQGIIEGDDGRSYCFHLRNWMTNRIPYLSDRVLFEIDDSYAIGVRLCTWDKNTPKRIFSLTKIIRTVRFVVAVSRTKLWRTRSVCADGRRIDSLGWRPILVDPAETHSALYPTL